MHAEWLETLELIRVFEERCEQLYLDGIVPSTMHLCTGQEAVPVGVCAALDDDDVLSFTYRSHGWALARGISPVEVLAECIGKSTGCNLGRGGSKHLGDWHRRILPASAIVAGHLPVAAGTAFAAARQGRPDVTVVVFGDGAMNQGVVHETLTLAALWSLPLIFVCENNQYAEMTPVAETLSGATIADSVAGRGVPVLRCDGMDVEDVHRAAREAVQRARSGAGPTFVEADTYRFCGHMTGDAQNYRTEDEVAAWRRRDPILTLRATRAEQGWSDEALDAVRDRALAQLTAAEEAARSAPDPTPEDVYAGAASWTVRTR